MIGVRRMRPADLEAIRVQPAQLEWSGEATTATGRELLEAGPAWSVLEDGAPIAAGGLIHAMGPPAIAWALLSVQAGRHLLALTRWARLVLALPPMVEAAIDPRFQAGERWATALGFLPIGRPVERWISTDNIWLRINHHGA